MENFERFDILSDDSDHYFHSLRVKRKSRKQKHSGEAASSNLEIERPVPNCFTNTGSGGYKRIMKEWKILANSLPESIYVRVYENRIDLLRAMIVGVAGTPYHDGLFFFDILFPPDYPNDPPCVHYRSYGFKINPNLYSNGDVCLSLINTWLGKNNERWDPSRSSILQLLVSLQGLVLNEKPIFNEFGSEILPPIFHKYAQAYNDTVFLLSCKTMLCVLQNPPLNFEAFVVMHFRDRARAILIACNDYVNGRVRVGRYSHEGQGARSSVRVSHKFRKAIQLVYPQLFAAFLKSGAMLESGLEQLKMQERNGSSKNVGDRKYRVIVRNVIGKIRKFYVSMTRSREKIDINFIPGEAEVAATR